ncbi:hypothetical protein [Macrococcus animalis]|uniref:hypothetical protein n=1 Tax=Macrococcus animalis TaxID=3395467 RepID=UPI0039BFA065
MFNIFKKKQQKTNDMLTVLGVDDRVRGTVGEEYLHHEQQIIELITPITEDEAKTIISGLPNNIYWMVGHVLVENEYRLSPNEVDPQVASLAKYFKSGTSPEDFDQQIPSFETLKSLLKTQTKRLLGEMCEKQQLNTKHDDIEFAANHMTLHLGQLKTMYQLLSAS